VTVLDTLNLNGSPIRLTLDGARIAAVEPVRGPARATIHPLPVEPHVHLDKTGTIGRARAVKPGLFGAIEAMAGDKRHWTADDLRSRIEAGMAEAYAAGVRAIRSHVDWSGPGVPLAWEIMGDVAADWADRMPLQRASLTGLDELTDPAAIAAQVARDGGVFGAFLYCHGDAAAKLKTIFDLAERHDLRLDFHVDEGLDPEARAFDLIVAETARRGMAGRVLCGHACSLSIRAADDLKRAADAAARAGVALTIQPTANLYLQDMSPGRMPRLRGLAPAQELRAAGVEVMLGTDNVRDPFVPFGTFDPMETLRLAWITGHLTPEEWSDAITDAPARALCLPPARIAPGEPADFLLFPAPSLSAALARPGAMREVWRGGKPMQPKA
jgi:cytosine/creatinine deaminase